MIDGFQLVLVIAAAVACGFMGGAFFAFSSFVMKALGRLQSDQAISAMQSINVTAVTPMFMTGVFGTAVLCIAVIVSALVNWTRPAGVYLLVGSGLYLVGVVGLTVVYHVPRNNALAVLDPGAEGAETYWEYYLKHWTRWNHVRTLAGIAAAVALTIALRVG